MPKAKVGSIEIYYENYGKGTPVLFVAGYGGLGVYWVDQVETFSKYFSVILHDHRGMGQSTHDTSLKYSVDQMADDVIGLMDALNIDRAHLIGHSLGGMIGQSLGIRHAHRFIDLVIYASLHKFDPWLYRCTELRRTILLKAGPQAFTETTSLFLYPSWWINSNNDRLKQLEDLSLKDFPATGIINQRTDAVVAFDLSADLHRIKLPTLLLCARDDFLTPPYFTEELAKLIPNSKVAWMEKGGHACSRTMPEEFNRIVLEFLLEHEERKR